MAAGWRLIANPRPLLFMLLKILFAALRPAQGKLHGGPSALLVSGVFGAFVERHNNVRAEPDLSLRRAFRSQKMRGAVQVRAESHAFFIDFSQIAQAKYLESAGDGQHRPPPRHEPVHS